MRTQRALLRTRWKRSDGRSSRPWSGRPRSSRRCTRSIDSVLTLVSASGLSVTGAPLSAALTACAREARLSLVGCTMMAGSSLGPAVWQVASANSANRDATKRNARIPARAERSKRLATDKDADDKSRGPLSDHFGAEIDSLEIWMKRMVASFPPLHDWVLLKVGPHQIPGRPPSGVTNRVGPSRGGDPSGTDRAWAVLRHTSPGINPGGSERRREGNKPGLACATSPVSRTRSPLFDGRPALAPRRVGMGNPTPIAGSCCSLDAARRSSGFAAGNAAAAFRTSSVSSVFKEPRHH